MTLDELLQAARSLLGGLDPQVMDRLEREQTYLRLKLRRGYDGLMRQRRLVESLHYRIVDRQNAVKALTCRVESYLQASNQVKAWHHALELDRLRNSLERDHTELGRLQRDYHGLVAEISRMEHRFAQVNEQLESLRVQPASANAW
jgi:phage shock protein A